MEAKSCNLIQTAQVYVKYGWYFVYRSNQYDQTEQFQDLQPCGTLMVCPIFFLACFGSRSWMLDPCSIMYEAGNSASTSQLIHSCSTSQFLLHLQETRIPSSERFAAHLIKFMFPSGKIHKPIDFMAASVPEGRCFEGYGLN